MVFLRKHAFRVQSNLGAHPSKIKNAASLLEATFESFNFHSDMWVRNELHAQPRIQRAQVYGSLKSPACSCVSITLPEQSEPPGLFLTLVVVGLDALDDDVIGAFFIDRPLAAVGVIA